jgi:hypothetical protein
MQFDLQFAQIAVGIVASILAILGTIFGWFGKARRWAASFFKPKLLVGLIDVPARTMVLIPASRSNALWWHMGSVGSEPAMQIVGDLNVTNISKYGIFVMGAKLRKPKAVGHALVRAQNSNLYDSTDMIPEGAVSELRFDFFVQPPVRKPGETFKADLAILDQFGNEHWLKGLEFPYV